MVGLASPTNTGGGNGPFHAQPSSRAMPISMMVVCAIRPILSDRCNRTGETRTVETLVFAGAKDQRSMLMKKPRHPQFRSSDRLGLVLLHHQADVLPDRLAVQTVR